MAASSEEISSPNGCFTCSAVEGRKTLPGGILWRDTLVIANHHEDAESDAPLPERRSAWVIVSPVRHVERVFDLSPQEWERLGDVIRCVDRALTDLYCSRRTMVASLGWFTRDHIHFHCAPTFGSEVSFGSQNFDGAYQPPPGVAPETAALAIKHYLHAHLTGSGD